MTLALIGRRSSEGMDHNLTLVAIGIVALWDMIDSGVTEPNSLTLISVTQRAAFIAAADYALGAIPINAFHSYFVGSHGLLLASLVLVRGVFRRLPPLLALL